jgi:carboxyl-terminal processing protease
MPEHNPTSKFQTRLPLLLAVTLAIGMLIGQQLPHYDRNFSLGHKNVAADGPLDEILRYVESKYVDSVDIDPLRRQAIEHLLEGLDPHSVYISPEELKAVEEDMNGEFEGVGIEFIVLDDTIQVVAPLAGGPSETAGILAGDKIVTINDTSIAGVNIENGKIYDKLRGPKGSKVKIGIKRGRETTLRVFEVVRDIIPVKSVDAAYMLDEQTGYIRVAQFNGNTYQEFMQSLTSMVEEKGLKNLVLDLRGNPGGYLEEATDMLSQIFPDGKLLVYTQGRAGQRKDYKSNGRARFDIQNIAVLIDEGSASASEIVAGAVQDWDRGWVLGRRSFGKGLVQEQYPLSNGGAVRLTVSRYYTPSGRCIQKDYKNDRDYEHEPERRLKNGELNHADKVQQADSTRYYTGQGRIVYGGGGITPDVFIPLDTSFSTPYYAALRALVPGFISRWTEQHDRSQLPANIQDFMSFQVPNEMLEALVAHAEKEGHIKNPQELNKCRRELMLQLKARLGKVLFGDEAFFRILNDDDPAVEKAVQLLMSGQRVK